MKPDIDRPERMGRGAEGSGTRTEESLLESLQRIIERTYRMETGVEAIGRFVIGDEGYRRFYARPGTLWRPGATCGEACSEARSAAAPGAPGAGAKVLVRDGESGVAARIYYPDALIAALERHPPGLGLGEPNVDAFATFVEELDHFLLIAERTRYARPVSLLELEMHAGVTKYLVCALFLSRGRAAAGPGRIGERERMWLRWHLFEKVEYAEPDPAAQARYRDAARYARKFLGHLDGEPLASVRLARLRAFHDSSHQEKLTALS